MNENLENTPDPTKKKEITYPQNHTLHWRAEHREGKQAVLIDPNLFPGENSPGKISQILKTRFKEIPGNVEIESHGPGSGSPLNRPIYVKSPGGTPYFREKTYGPFVFYTNKTPQEMEISMVSKDPEPAKTEVVSEKLAEVDPDAVSTILKKSDDFVKFQEIVITGEKLKDLRKQKLKRGQHGIPGQAEIMVQEGVSKKEASATNIANLLGMNPDNELYEWLHLIAFMLLGAAAQEKNNLTGGTKHANTDMIFAEDEVVYLAYCLEEEITLRVAAVEYPDTHMGKKIIYNIVTKKFTIPFLFDAQTTVQPDIVNKKYIHSIVEFIVELSQGLLEVKKEPPKRKIDFEKTSEQITQQTPEQVLDLKEKDQSQKKSELEPELKPAFRTPLMPRMFFKAKAKSDPHLLTNKQGLIAQEIKKPKPNAEESTQIEAPQNTAITLEL